MLWAFTCNCCGLRFNFEEGKTRNWWKKVVDSVSSYVAKDPKQCMDGCVSIKLQAFARSFESIFHLFWSIS